MNNRIQQQKSSAERNCTISIHEVNALIDSEEIEETTVNMDIDHVDTIELILKVNGKQVVDITDIDLDVSREIKVIISNKEKTIGKT